MIVMLLRTADKILTKLQIDVEIKETFLHFCNIASTHVDILYFFLRFYRIISLTISLNI